MKKIVILCPYPLNQAPSQRFRFEQYLTLFEEKDFKITFLPLYNQSAWNYLRGKQSVFHRYRSLIEALFTQILKSLRTSKYDFVFIHREILPIGPPFLEWIISKVFKKKIIYDFDDAIWLTDKTNESWIESKLRWRSKVASICGWSYKVSCGNKYLCNYATHFNKNVVLNPTTIDTDLIHNRSLYQSIPQTDERTEDTITIGWTGSHSTLKYLEELQLVLKQVEEKYPHVHFLVIADRPPNLKLKNLIFKQWSKETEIKDLMLANIGIMPLPDDEWAKGKCGFKALQYMALEIPCIASPVGVNTSIIQHNVNGFLCNNSQEWLNCFHLLITNELLRRQVGKEGRITVEKSYSVKSNAANFLSLFE